QTRLGKGFYESHRLQAAAIERTAEVVTKFAAKAKELEAATIRVIATSAARDAVNGRELIDAIKNSSGLAVEIISGQQEADWVFQGVTSAPSLSQGALLLLDVGGGSAEFIVGCGKEKMYAESFPVGTVRLMERFPHGDPPTRAEFAACRNWLDDFLVREIKPRANAALQEAARKSKSRPVRLVATGGT